MTCSCIHIPALIRKRVNRTQQPDFKYEVFHAGVHVATVREMDDAYRVADDFVEVKETGE